MERKRVISSNIESIGYDVGTKILEVEFSDGSVYQYSNVPQRTYERLVSAPSHGHFLDAYIKKARYRYRQVR